MKILLTGGSKSGKSHLAQDLAVMLSKGGPRYYIATMIPCDDEDWERIRLHLEDREGLGFETIEAGRDITSVLRYRKGKGTYLLDSLTALYANEMFHDGRADTEAVERVIADLTGLIDQTEHLVMVTDDLYKDAAVFDELTEQYRAGLGAITCEAAKRCDVVMDMRSGIPVYLKGDGKLIQTVCDPENVQQTEGRGMTQENIRETVIGGAFQGQEHYIREKYKLTDEDIWVCDDKSLPDLKRRGLLHLEKYVRYCMLQHIEPVMILPDDCIVSFNDISCGLVPVESFDRAYREKAGLYLKALTDMSRQVTYVTAGIPRTIKMKTDDVPEC